MSQYILLKDIKVENANAIQGITYGFPSPTNFLGYTHALSRALQQQFGSVACLGGVGIVCHEHQVLAQRIGYETVFALTRNPVTHEGKTAPFNEEGRMHMRVSLLIECEFDILSLEVGDGTPEQREKLFCDLLRNKAVSQRLAGGTITQIGLVKALTFNPANADYEREFRRWMLRLIPGFVLQDRHDALQAHHQQRLEQNNKAELLDSWLDFIALDSHATLADDFEGEAVEGESSALWQIKPKPEVGYFVPLAIGFTSISELYSPGEVARARDNSVPFGFVESIYSLAQWVGPHRIKTPEDMLWHYHYQQDEHKNTDYLCRNKKRMTNTALAEQDLNDFDDDY